MDIADEYCSSLLECTYLPIRDINLLLETYNLKNI